MKILWHVTLSWLPGNALVVSAPVKNEKERETTLVMRCLATKTTSHARVFSWDVMKKQAIQQV